jgi:putative ABC transport system permease protein
MLIQMAFRNIFRNKRRTVLTMIAVFFGVFLLIVFNGFSSGMEWQIGDLFIKTSTGAIKIVSSNYKIDDLENPLDYPIKSYQDMEHLVSQNKKIQAYSPRITFQGSLNNGVDEISATGIGVKPFLEDSVFDRRRSIIAGSFLKPGEDGLVVGADLAKLLDVKVGDTISVIAQATQMGKNAFDLEIKGMIRTGNPLIDEYSFFVPIDFARNFLTIEGITDIAVKLRDVSDIDRVIGELNTKNPKSGNSILSWRDFANDYMGLIEYRKRMIGLVSIAILIIAGVGIINTMLMAMLERKREIGNLMALGLRRSEIMRLFLLEGTFIGLLASFAAAILGSLFLCYGQINGLPLNLNEIGNSTVVGKLYLHFNLLYVIGFFLLGVVIVSCSTLYPALKSARLNPVEALRDDRR